MVLESCGDVNIVMKWRFPDGDDMDDVLDIVPGNASIRSKALSASSRNVSHKEPSQIFRLTQTQFPSKVRLEGSNSIVLYVLCAVFHGIVCVTIVSMR